MASDVHPNVPRLAEVGQHVDAEGIGVGGLCHPRPHLILERPVAVRLNGRKLHTWVIAGHSM
jgi:hypothetical protein